MIRIIGGVILSHNNVLNRFFVLLLTILSLTSNSKGQDLIAALADDSIKFSRTRLMAGLTYLYAKYESEEFSSPFINFSYRSSDISDSSKIYKFGFSFEPGINILFLKGSQSFSPYFLPYLKIGPEIYLGNNLILGGSFGLLIFLSGEASNLAYPFSGLNLFYLFNLDDEQFIELETGFHTTMTFRNSHPLLFYLSIGLAFK